MNVALRKPMSLAEFLAWEERQELRYEFDGFQPVAMTGERSGTIGLRSISIRRSMPALPARDARRADRT